MTRLVRRFLVLAALMFWLGGFTFYASVVVFVGQGQLGHRRQGFITAEVTNYLNLACAAALAVLAWDLALLRDRCRRRTLLLWLCWLGMLATLAGLAWLHRELEGLMIADGHLLTDRARYRALHRTYLWVSTVQWALGLGYLALTLGSWRDRDRRDRAPS